MGGGREPSGGGGRPPEPCERRQHPLVDPACDAGGDGIVDDLSPDYAEGQQYGNLLNFYSVTMGSSPLHSAAPMEAMKLAAGLELSYIPQLGCAEQAVFCGYKTEPTNKSPVFPRLHLRFGLPGGAYVGVNGVPPVPAFGVRTGMIGGELGYGRVLADHIELGGRTALEFGHVVGDLAGPLPNQIDTADSFSDRLWSVEGGISGLDEEGAGRSSSTSTAGRAATTYKDVFFTDLHFEQNIELLVPFDDPGRFLAKSRTLFTVPISTSIRMRTSLELNYQGSPAPNTDKLDILGLVGLEYQF